MTLVNGRSYPDCNCCYKLTDPSPTGIDGWGCGPGTLRAGSEGQGSWLCAEFVLCACKAPLLGDTIGSRG